MFENFNADHNWRREWTGRNLRGFPPKKFNERILRQWQQTYLEKFLCLYQFFFCFFFYKDQRRKDGNDFEADTVSGFQNPPELKRDKTYSALSFDRTTFFNMANLFTLFRKPVVMCYCFLEPIKLSFLTPVKLLSNRVSCSCFRSPKLEEAI